ncbi:hypothetical protein EA14781_088_00010 [Escherichia albertii NBRC 107761 = DSM 17582]|nr:hypothetical protein EA14781_088_00010 [Escherichia albertii NBRC 107761 = DSM 17582]
MERPCLFTSLLQQDVWGGFIILPKPEINRIINTLVKINGADNKSMVIAATIKNRSF